MKIEKWISYTKLVFFSIIVFAGVKSKLFPKLWLK